ncbi:MAG: hypothetical protein QY323_04455 [Patescibacteria group bacterium]|nr:MAG: hypothetical protein QY323_04455 [Patescibacteria group bacterium]
MDAPKEDALGTFLRTGGAKPGSKIEIAYRTLAARLAGKTGQCVLMIERDGQQPGPCGGSMTPLREGFTLGLLAGDALCFTPQDGEKHWTFPTLRYAKRGDHMFRHIEDDKEIRVVNGGMAPWYGSVFFEWLEQRVDLGDQTELASCSIGVGFGKPITRLSMFIGNDEIAAWCLEGHAQRIRTIAALTSAVDADPKTLFAGPLIDALQRAVERLRAAKDEALPIRSEIRFLLGEAEHLRIDEPFIQRLRAAHPAK